MSREWLAYLGIGVLFGILLAHNDARSQSNLSHDKWGYEQPVECRRDISFIPSPIKRVEMGYTRSGAKRLGRWVGDYTPWGFILVDVSVSERLLPHVVHHERCHALFFHLYGTAHWHMEDE